jgi:hypothetical protein
MQSTRTEAQVWEMQNEVKVGKGTVFGWISQFDLNTKKIEKVQTIQKSLWWRWWRWSVERSIWQLSSDEENGEKDASSRPEVAVNVKCTRWIALDKWDDFWPDHEVLFAWAACYQPANRALLSARVSAFFDCSWYNSRGERKSKFRWAWEEAGEEARFKNRKD